MDHRTFLAAFSTNARKRLTERRNLPGIVHLAGHLALILLTGIPIALRLPLWPALLLPHGIFLIFLFTLEHEATHKTPFASRPLNEWVGRLVGLVILLPFEWFRYFHLAHHRYTNIPGKDPELLAGAKPEGWVSYAKYVSGLPYWASMMSRILRNAAGCAEAPYLPQRALSRIRSEARWMLGLYTLAALSLAFSPALIWLWLVPLLLGQPFLRLFLLAEHGRCAAVSNMFQNTRTTFTTRIIRFLSWNMPFHAEHHTMPDVPFHALPELHKFTRAHLQVTGASYSRVSRDYCAGFPPTPREAHK